MLARFGATTRPEVARRTFLAISLRPDAVAEADRPRVARLAAVDTDRTSRWSMLARDVAAFWEGRYAEACAGLGRTALQFREAPGTPSPAEAWINFLRAMAYQKSGRPAEARRELEAGVAWLARNTPKFDRGETLGTSWPDHARAAIYRRQAEAMVLLDPIFPADPFAR